MPPTLPAPPGLVPPHPSFSGAQARSPHNVPLLFFGTSEVACLRPAVLTRFEAGVARSFHAPKAGRKGQAFRRSLCEVETYLRVRAAILLSLMKLSWMAI